MVRSRSRSPRWKHRSLSPAFRSPEHHRQRHAHINYDCEYKELRKDLKKPMSWRVEEGKYGENNSRFQPHGNIHQRIYEHRTPSPNLKRIPLENTYSNKPYRTYSPERGEGNRRYSFPPKYSEIAYKEHDRSFYPHKMQERYMPEDFRVIGGGKGMKSFHRPLGASCKFERKWHEDEMRHQRLQEDKYGQSLRRASEEFTTRYPEDRDYREHGHTSKTAKEIERYEGGEIARNHKWKQDRSFPPYQIKEEQRKLGPQTHRSSEKEYTKNSVTKIAYDYSHKHHRHTDVTKSTSELYHQKNIKQEDQKYNSLKGARNSKERDYCSGGRVRRTEDGHNEVPVKYSSEKGCNACANSYKNDVDLRPFNNTKKERIRNEGNVREKIDSSNSHRDTSHTVSDVKMSDLTPKKELLTIKVDMKKVMNKYRTASSHTVERQMSHDLVAVGKKNENFHPVFEHMESVTQNAETSPSKEFTQEIITIIHQVKANYFTSSDLTLNERFSKIQEKPDANLKEVKIYSDPEIHRRIDISLAELQNKRAMSCESGQTVMRVLEDPNDLRHDIERRRKERLQNEDERMFHLDGIIQRNEHNCNFSKLQNSQIDGFRKPVRFIKPPPFRKFIRKPYMNSYYAAKTNDIFTHRPFGGHLENPRPFRRPFKNNFADGRFQHSYKSGLVQKGLYIQAKYQRLRSAGVRGFTTYKFKEGFLRKEKEQSGIATET
ncbi:BCLAF1 and THRAP3 family member 3 isoform X2 [Carettochelys insculpta]|uniref:BCLAF1 and THRAP3 family member 3 isoform X2 n=1 Tax=Carettochelys insculpta TaxID=44489 RepID=UPI003EBF27ED